MDSIFVQQKFCPIDLHFGESSLPRLELLDQRIEGAGDMIATRLARLLWFSYQNVLVVLFLFLTTYHTWQAIYHIDQENYT